MATNAQSRKWMLTINNPQTCELDHDRIREILSLFSPNYFCMAHKLLQNVKDGMTTTEIIEESPSFAFKSRDIDTLRTVFQGFWVDETKI